MPRRLLLALLLLASCAHPPRGTETLEEARKGADSSPRAAALAGFHAWLVDGDAAAALKRFDQALQKDPAEPYALTGKVLLERRRLHPERALGFALDLCERAPHHPLAAFGARYALDMAGAAVPLDQEILTRGAKALAAGIDGDAAQLLRSAMAHISSVRGDDAGQARLLAEMGVPNRYTLLGPFSAFHVLEFDGTVPPEKDGSLAGPFTGPFGRLEPRSFTFRDPRFDLEGETDDGDLYVLAVDLDAADSADHFVRGVGTSSYRVYVDGEKVLERRAFARSLPSVLQQAIHLDRGRHRLLVKLLREDRGSSIALALPRADGRPASITFLDARGPAPRWSGVPRPTPPRGFPSAADLARALEPEAGLALAGLLAIRDGMGRDRDGAKALMQSLEKIVQGPALTSLRADLALGDRTVPQKVARGRATRDLEVTAEKDPQDLSALLTRAAIALDDGRSLEAAALVKQAKAAVQSPGYPALAVESRLNLALGVDAQADASAVDALQVQPGLCEALTTRYDLARRRDAVALSDDLVKSLELCPGARPRDAEHARMRGDVAGAAKLYQQLLDRDPSSISASVALANLQISQRQFDAAEQTLRRVQALWPRSAQIPKRLAEVLDLAGKPKEALEERERSLRLDGSDLTLRRTVARARTDAEPLEAHAIDGKAALQSYAGAPGQEDTPYAYVLDAAAIQAFPDGSQVDRIHIIQKALDQGGVPEIAEVTLPSGAQLLALRTIKADGTVLEPEGIEGKETVSLPGVQVGDFIEYEYLLAHDARGPSQPGFTSTNFYFQIASAPNNWSTYTVIAPKGARMAADPHNLKLPPDALKAQGDQEVFFHEERRVPPYIPEPSGPPSATEYIPFVSVGAGTEGNGALVAAYADAYGDRGQLTYEIDQFARQAAAGQTGVEAVRALYAAVMQRLSGRDAGLGQSASSSLAQDRGSRLWVLKASLESIGIPARLAAVRTFAADPSPSRFPNEALLPFVGLYVEVPGQAAPLWLDTSLRFGPFGQLPEQAAGARQAWLLPEPGRPGRELKTPVQPKEEGKKVELKLSLAADGVLTGSGDEKYTGREAAQLAEALEQLSPDQKNQALQSALSRYFGGAELSGLRLDGEQKVGAPLTVHYEFRAPRFGRLEGEGAQQRMMLPPLTFPVHMGRRYVQLGSRRTPLFIDDTELTRTHAEVQLPSGFTLREPVIGYQLHTRFGAYDRNEQVDAGGKATIDELYRLEMARIAPRDYEAFSRFAGEVDLVQVRDVVLIRR
ncbi:MAG TPA: tetratricopeptide repeat protein [Myxococcaceae bacterium]|nr:tetratricopeptide repeat protein [Myxococcaceae bacterium]